MARRTHPSDDHLIAQLLAARASGDVDALNAAAWSLVAHHQGGLRALARRAAWSAWGKETIEDFAAELLLVAHRKIRDDYDPTHPSEAKILTYLRPSARALARRHHGRVHNVISLGEHAVRAATAAASGEYASADDLAAALGCSPEQARLALSGALDGHQVGLEALSDDGFGIVDVYGASGTLGADPADLIIERDTVERLVAVQAEIRAEQAAVSRTVRAIAARRSSQLRRTTARVLPGQLSLFPEQTFG